MPELEDLFPCECRTRHPYDQVVPWLEENVGQFNEAWYRYGTDIASGVSGWEPYDYYRFRREQDAVLFRLRWS